MKSIYKFDKLEIQKERGLWSIEDNPDAVIAKVWTVCSPPSLLGIHDQFDDLIRIQKIEIKLKIKNEIERLIPPDNQSPCCNGNGAIQLGSWIKLKFKWRIRVYRWAPTSRLVQVHCEVIAVRAKIYSHK